MMGRNNDHRDTAYRLGSVKRAIICDVVSAILLRKKSSIDIKLGGRAIGIQ
jgi:hypothetical protein